MQRYRAQQAEEKQPLHNESRAWVVLPEQDKPEFTADDESDDSDALYSMEEFIRWPDYVSTGNVVLDKHLQRLSFHVNGLHYAYKHRRPLAVLTKERENVCQAITFLAQVVSRSYADNASDPLLQHLQQSLDTLNDLNKQLLALDLVRPQKLAEVLRDISHWWLATCSWQFMEKTQH